MTDLRFSEKLVLFLLAIPVGFLLGFIFIMVPWYVSVTGVTISIVIWSMMYYAVGLEK